MINNILMKDQLSEEKAIYWIAPTCSFLVVCWGINQFVSRSIGYAGNDMCCTHFYWLILCICPALIFITFIIIWMPLHMVPLAGIKVYRKGY